MGKEKKRAFSVRNKSEINFAIAKTISDLLLTYRQIHTYVYSHLFLARAIDINQIIVIAIVLTKDIKQIIIIK